jgi:hypothetical protein
MREFFKKSFWTTILKMETANSFETSVSNYNITFLFHNFGSYWG